MLSACGRRNITFCGCSGKWLEQALGCRAAKAKFRILRGSAPCIDFIYHDHDDMVPRDDGGLQERFILYSERDCDISESDSESTYDWHGGPLLLTTTWWSP